jgi:hypothetical protein
MAGRYLRSLINDTQEYSLIASSNEETFGTAPALPLRGDIRRACPHSNPVPEADKLVDADFRIRKSYQSALTNVAS